MKPFETAPARAAVGIAAIVFLSVVVVSTYSANVAQRSPIDPAGAWRLAFVLGVGGAVFCYFAALLAYRRPEVPVPLALGVATTLQLIPLAAPLLLSLDVYAYWDYGRLLVEHGLNPYADPPSAASADPAYDLIGRDWRDRPAIYGPVFIALAAGHALVVGVEPETAAFLWRVLAAGNGVALAVLATRLARRPAFAAVFLGWNPLVALHLAGGGHNDGLLMALVLGALLLARRGRPQLGGALWAAAIAIKPVPMALLPLAAIGAGRLRGFGWSGLVAAAAAIAVLATAAFGTAWISSAAPFGQLDRVSSASIPFWISKLGISWRYPTAALSLVFAVAYLALLLQAWRGRTRLALTAALLPLSLAWLMPWYAIWSISLAAWEEDRLARGLALALTLYLLRDAVPL